MTSIIRIYSKPRYILNVSCRMQTRKELMPVQMKCKVMLNDTALSMTPVNKLTTQNVSYFSYLFENCMVEEVLR